MYRSNTVDFLYVQSGHDIINRLIHGRAGSVKRRIISIALCFLLLSAVSAFADALYNEWQQTAKIPVFRDHIGEWTESGAAVTPEMMRDPAVTELIRDHFSTLTLVNGESEWVTPDRERTLAENDPDRLFPDTAQLRDILKFARDNGLKIVSQELIRPDNNPEWIFLEDFGNGPDGKTVSPERMLKRLQSYIREVIRTCNDEYPGTVIAWNVTGDILNPSDGDEKGYRTDTGWYGILGSEWVRQAFMFAGEAAEQDQLLYLSGDGVTGNRMKKAVTALLADLKQTVRVDGFACRASLGKESPTPKEIVNALKQIGKDGSRIRIIALNVPPEDDTLTGQLRQAARYRSLMSAFSQAVRQNKLLLDGISFDAFGPGGLFTEANTPDFAFFGALQSEDIPMYATEEAVQEFATRMDEQEKIARKRKEMENADMDTLIKGLVKPVEEHNPLMVQKFGADPWAMEYNGRIYIYMTGDEPVTGGDGKVVTNTYGNINTIRVISSDDLVNWTDHGEIHAAGRNGAAKWATNSWAPAAAWKNINGQDKFFLYFADSGNGIGVLTAESPAGPFTDPIGKPLVSRSTPSCASVTWLFDPAVLVDDDGSAYLYVGGGVPEGKTADPGTARAVALNDDMVSLKTTPVAICPPYLFEDSGINKLNGKYIYSYCTNFNVTAQATAKYGFDSGEIAYMISDSPMGPFTYKGGILKNPGHFFGQGGNNHHCMFSFGGKLYITYHAQTLEGKLGMKGKGYRSTFINELSFDPETYTLKATGNMKGVDAVKTFDPYAQVSGATAATLNNVVMKNADGCENSAGCVAEFDTNGLLILENVDFGEQNGELSLQIRYAAKDPARIECCIDPEGERTTIVDASLNAGDGWQTAKLPLNGTVNGVHTLAIRIEGKITDLDWWQICR